METQPYVVYFIRLAVQRLPSVARLAQFLVSDVAGEVVEVGPGVNKFKVGDKVVAMLSAVTGGGFAEYAVAPQNMTVNRPPEVSAGEGASLPIAGITALQALTKTAGIKLDGSGKQSNILITAASGGVGHYAVQLAKLGNTHVTATCGARNIEFVKSLGADEVLDYRTPEGSALKSPSGRKYDAVIHCTTNIPWSTFEPNLSENGKVIDLTPSPGAMMTFAYQKLTFSKKLLVPLMVSLNGGDLECLVGLTKEGRLKTMIDSRYPLSKAEDAWARSIEGHATAPLSLSSHCSALRLAAGGGGIEAVAQKKRTAVIFSTVITDTREMKMTYVRRNRSSRSHTHFGQFLMRGYGKSR
ncbi:hypothetical protein ACLOJK_022534 [Asimina triloba]